MCTFSHEWENSNLHLHHSTQWSANISCWNKKKHSLHWRGSLVLPVSLTLCVVLILGLVRHISVIYVINYANTVISITCVDTEDVSSTSAMLEHMKHKHPRVAGFIGSYGAVKRFRLVRRCGSVTPRSVCVTCWEPRWSVCWKTDHLCCYATGKLVLFVIVCPHQPINNYRKWPGWTEHYSVIK